MTLQFIVDGRSHNPCYKDLKIHFHVIYSAVSIEDNSHKKTENNILIKG